MFNKRLITTSVLSFTTALLLGTSLIISNKLEKVSAINDTHDHVGWTGWTGVTELPTEAGDYYLTDNVELSETWNVPEGITNLCLNGFVVKLADGSTGSVIKVFQNAALNLYDCDTTTSHNGYVDSTGLWHFDATDTHVLGANETERDIIGGIITGGNNNTTLGNGGGVQVDKGKFDLYGGNIVGNYAKNGAGVQVSSATEGVIASFEMSGGTISYNKALTGGGGVSISNKHVEFNMTGGEITNNVVNSNFGGGVLTQYDITLGGTAKITGNTANGATNNVYLYGKTITLGTSDYAPTTMSVGITTKTAPTDIAPVKITADGAADYSANFFSDNQNYCINYNTQEYLELVNISALNDWANTYLHLEETESNGYCKDATHQWYRIAKTNLIPLGDEMITILQTSADAKVSSYRARYEAWARANGDYEHCYENDFTHIGSNIAKIVTVNNTVTLIALISLVSILAIGGYFLLRKKTNVLKK